MGTFVRSFELTVYLVGSKPLTNLYPYFSELLDTGINLLRSFEVKELTGVPST